MAPWGVRAHVPIRRPESRLGEGTGAARAHTARGRRRQDRGDLPRLRGPSVPTAHGRAASGSLTHHARARAGRASSEQADVPVRPHLEEPDPGWVGQDGQEADGCTSSRLL